MADRIYLGEDTLIRTGDEREGCNDNILIFGQTGAGKTFSINIPTALHMKESSCVMTLSKRKDAEKMIRNFTDKGYEVMDLNFAEPEHSNVVFDPLEYVKTSEDAINLAKAIIENDEGQMASWDPYWDRASESVLTSTIAVLMMPDLPQEVLEPYWVEDGRCSFAELITMSQMLMCRNETDGKSTCKLDHLFEEIEKIFGRNNLAVQSYNSIRGLAYRTASCIASQVVASLNSFISDSILKMMKSDMERVDFVKLGRKRTALIITTNPVNRSLNRYLSLCYSMLFKELFEEAEKNGGRLKNRVMIFVDDFGNNKIDRLDQHISIFREAGISTVMFLQSEDQLMTMYCDKANIIKDNCGTLCFFTGSQNIATCKDIANRIDMPLSDVLALQLGKIIICCNGHKPKIVSRYKTLDDILYKECFAEQDIR